MPIEFGEKVRRIPVYPAAEGYGFEGPVAKMASNESPYPPIPAVINPAAGGYTVEAAIPLSGLNISSVTPPQRLRFDIGFDDDTEKALKDAGTADRAEPDLQHHHRAQREW